MTEYKMNLPVFNIRREDKLENYQVILTKNNLEVFDEKTSKIMDIREYLRSTKDINIMKKLFDIIPKIGFVYDRVGNEVYLLELSNDKKFIEVYPQSFISKIELYKKYVEKYLSKNININKLHNIIRKSREQEPIINIRRFNSNNPYTVLGVNRGNNIKTIEKIYKRLALKYHPDRGGSAEIFQKIGSAFNKIDKKIGVTNENKKKKIIY